MTVLTLKELTKTLCYVHRKIVYYYPGSYLHEEFFKENLIMILEFNLPPQQVGLYTFPRMHSTSTIYTVLGTELPL